MSRKSFVILLVATLLMVAITTAARLMLPDYRIASAQSILAFPGFAKDVNKAASVSIATADGQITLARENEDRWVIVERDGYVADTQKIRESLLALTRMTAVEAKTRRADRYHRIEVDDPSSDPEAKGMRLRVNDQNGVALLDVIMGKSVTAASGVSKGGVYYRLADDEQSWLGGGRPEMGVLVEDWIRKQIVDVKRARLSRVTLVHADGETIKIVRPSETSDQMELLGIPAGYKLQSDFRRDSIPAFLNELTISDVAREGSIDLSGKKISETTYETMDGLTAVLTMFGDDEVGYWVSISAKGVDTAESEAADMNGRLNGWLFRVSNWKSGDLKRRMSDLVEPDKPEAATGG